MTGEFRMTRMRLEVPRLHQLARRRRLPVRADDLGYVVHCEMKELFGDGAPAPFALVEGAGRWLTVIGYTRRTSSELVDHVRAFADPSAAAALDLDSVADKALPLTWPVGRRLGFEVRACPVVRLSSDVTLPGGGRVARGAEVDAYLARCWRTTGVVIREEVYREWFTEELRRRGGCALSDVRLIAMKRSALVRRDHAPERTSHLAERPDVTFKGLLEVTDGEVFARLLERGVGRHRGFGFGMLLLSAPVA